MYGIIFKNIIVAYLDFKKSQLLKRRAPTNDEDPFNEISKIMDTRPISIKKHEWTFAKMVPISNTKHKMAFLEF